MMAALKSTLLEILGSKKALVLIATAGASLAARLGWHVTEADLEPYLIIVSGYLVGQGIADHGKEAATVTAAASKAVSP